MSLFFILSCLLWLSYSSPIYQNMFTDPYYSMLTQACDVCYTECSLPQGSNPIVINYYYNSTLFVTQAENSDLTISYRSVSVNDSEDKTRGIFALTERNDWFEFKNCDGLRCLAVNSDLIIETNTCDSADIRQRFKIYFAHTEYTPEHYFTGHVQITAFNGHRVYFDTPNSTLLKADGRERWHDYRNFNLQRADQILTCSAN